VRDWGACSEALRDVYFSNHEHDMVYEEAEKERESFEGLRTWLGGVAERNIGTVEEHISTLPEDMCEQEGEVGPEELRPFQNHYIWSTS
jgi:hypothetical protein